VVCVLCVIIYPFCAGFCAPYRNSRTREKGLHRQGCLFGDTYSSETREGATRQGAKRT
jgi:hypothetical protein